MKCNISNSFAIINSSNLCQTFHSLFHLSLQIWVETMNAFTKMKETRFSFWIKFSIETIRWYVLSTINRHRSNEYNGYKWRNVLQFQFFCLCLNVQHLKSSINTSIASDAFAIRFYAFQEISLSYNLNHGKYVYNPISIGSRISH